MSILESAKQNATRTRSARLGSVKLKKSATDISRALMETRPPENEAGLMSTRQFVVSQRKAIDAMRKKGHSWESIAVEMSRFVEGAPVSQDTVRTYFYTAEATKKAKAADRARAQERGIESIAVDPSSVDGLEAAKTRLPTLAKLVR